MVTDSNQASTRTHDKLFKLGDADSYNEVVDLLDKYTEQVTRHLPAPMMAMAGVQANQHILDIGTGTGTGIVALEVARNLSEGGKVVGIDLSDGMLATARAKAEKEGLAGQAEFLKMDAEALQFEDNAFDNVLSLYALRHFPNPEKAVSCRLAKVFWQGRGRGGWFTSQGSQSSLRSSPDGTYRDRAVIAAVSTVSAV
jgi:2-polyprenyl-3-methyl-5-hydroxy-6-metoxy-1,4-benzoquinol methylase